VTSDVGLKEIVIYSDCKPYRRFLLNGAKEFNRPLSGPTTGSET